MPSIADNKRRVEYLNSCIADIEVQASRLEVALACHYASLRECKSRRDALVEEIDSQSKESQ